MGRAIVRNPSVFLMDEPLSNLDAKLRVQHARRDQPGQRQVGVLTQVYVTHDQTEAMTMGHRVCVLRDGFLQQCDTPQALYDRPVNMFVAAFIGSPAMNLYEGVLTDGCAALRIGSQQIPLSEQFRLKRPELATFGGRAVILGVRPENLRSKRRRQPRAQRSGRAGGGARFGAAGALLIGRQARGRRRLGGA